MDSNYFILRYTRIHPTEQEKRLAYLDNALVQLRAYYIKAKPAKRPIIQRLIVVYENLLENKRSIS